MHKVFDALFLSGRQDGEARVRFGTSGEQESAARWLLPTYVFPTRSRARRVRFRALPQTSWTSRLLRPSQARRVCCAQQRPQPNRGAPYPRAVLDTFPQRVIHITYTCVNTVQRQNIISTLSAENRAHYCNHPHKFSPGNGALVP